MSIPFKNLFPFMGDTVHIQPDEIEPITATRVPFADADGHLSSSAALTFNSSTGALSATSFVGAMGGTDVVITGNTDIGNAVTDTCTITAAIDSDLTFIKEVNRTVSVGTTTMAATAGATLGIAAGAGATTGNGGALTLAGGAAPGVGTGGAVNINGGASASGTAGAVNIGASNTSAVNITPNVDITGNLVVRGDVDLGNAAADTITLVGTIDSADVNFTKEAAHAINVVTSTTADTAGGSLGLQAGHGVGTGIGANLNLYAGSAGLTGATGGNVVINAGAAAGGTAGEIRLGGTNTSATKIHGLKYPTADGTVGQVLKTDGAGVLSFATTVMAQSEASGTISAADLKTANASPVSLVASPGAGKINVVDEIELFLDFGGNAHVRDGGNEELVIQYGTGGVDIHAFANATDAFLTSGADAHRIIRPTIYNSAAVGFDPASADDEAIVAYITNSELGAAGDSPIKYRIKYRTITLLT